MDLSNEPDSWSDEEIPGLWPFSIDKCCIYRVPNELRRVNPVAYTPQMLLIGPFHYSKKFDKTDSRYVDFINMERYKKQYVTYIENRCGTQAIEDFKKIIQGHEQHIRESYAESTNWIKSKEFVEMVLRDSMFILRVISQPRDSFISSKRNILFDQPCLFNIIIDDLLLLENQLPFFILTELFEPFYQKYEPYHKFRDNVIEFFGFRSNQVRSDVKFLHLTDLLRHVRVMTLGIPVEEIDIDSIGENRINTLETTVMNMQNADRLNCAGIEFSRWEPDSGISLAIRFHGRTLKMPCFTLKMPCFTADDKTEKMLRNIMALEQSHYSFSAYVCSYVSFLNCLIKTEQDVDLLVKKGVIKNCLESSQRSVTKMVDKLCEGIVITGYNYYSSLAGDLDSHYRRSFATLRINLSIAALRRVYFKDLWTGTATVSAVILLVLTLIGTVASVFQAMQGAPNNSPTKSPSPPASTTRGL